MGNVPEKIISEVIPNMDFHKHVLVVGGGADNTVTELIRNKKCERITYIDISNILAAKAVLRLNSSGLMGKLQTDFIVKDFLSMESERVFDALVFPYYLDLFENSEIHENIVKTKRILNQNGVVYVIDFASSIKSSAWQRIKEWGLYFVFHPITKVNRRTFPNHKQLFEKNGFKQTHSSTYKNGFYAALTFKRNL